MNKISFIYLAIALGYDGEKLWRVWRNKQSRFIAWYVMLSQWRSLQQGEENEDVVSTNNVLLVDTSVINDVDRKSYRRKRSVPGGTKHS